MKPRQNHREYVCARVPFRDFTANKMVKFLKGTIVFRVFLTGRVEMSTIKFCGKETSGVVVEGIFIADNGRGFIPFLSLMGVGELALPFSLIAKLSQLGESHFPADCTKSEFERLSKLLDIEQKSILEKALKAGGALKF
jgi:hypothetical protein